MLGQPRALPAHRSTSQLLPATRAEALLRRRAHLHRQLNQLADQLYRLKYDTESEGLQLQQLMRRGEDITRRASRNQEQLQIDRQLLENAVGKNSQPDRELQLETLPLCKPSELSERSTDPGSATDRHEKEGSIEVRRERPTSCLKDSVERAAGAVSCASEHRNSLVTRRSSRMRISRHRRTLEWGAAAAVALLLILLLLQ